MKILNKLKNILTKFKNIKPYPNQLYLSKFDLKKKYYVTPKYMEDSLAKIMKYHGDTFMKKYNYWYNHTYKANVTYLPNGDCIPLSDYSCTKICEYNQKINPDYNPADDGYFTYSDELL